MAPPMPRLYALCALLALLAAPAASAQITLTRADVETYLSSTGTASDFDLAGLPAGLQALADRSGPNQTWDLTAFAWTPGVVSTFAPAAGEVPGSDIPELQSATHVVRFDDGEDVAYTYFRVGAGFDALGAVSLDEETGETVGLRFSPYDRGFPLPLTAGATWSEAYALAFVPAIDGVATDVAETSAVEGWGTLVTPAGRTAVLKVRTKMVVTSTIEVEGEEPFVTADSLYTVEFISASGAGASISLDGEGVVDGASYTVVTVGGTTAGEGAPPRSTLALTLRSAHPVRRGGPVEVGFTLEAAGAVTVEAYDALGRRVATLAEGARAAGPQRAVLSTAALPAGVYVVRVRAGTEAGALRVTVTD